MVDEKKKVTKKQGTSNSTKKPKGTSKKNNKGKVNKKIIFAIISILIIIGIIITTIIFSKRDEVIITIDNIEYTESDFNMYAYLIKYDYFGIDGTKLSENTLKTQVTNDSDETIGEYLKDKTVSKIKISAAILRIAEENNITLTEEDLKEIAEEKEVFIENLGGMDEYKQMLKDNYTNDIAYIKAAKIDKLYTKIFNALYSEGKRNDLTSDELNTYTLSYQNDYVKIKQIILLKKDLDTNKYLSDTVLNQKEELANNLVIKATPDNFSELIKKYSESYDGEVKSEYYLKDNLLNELYEGISLLDTLEISNVISTDYAYHIVIREELDLEYLEEYLNSKREEKLIQDITDNLEKIAIINSDYLKEITVK